MGHFITRKTSFTLLGWVVGSLVLGVCQSEWVRAQVQVEDFVLKPTIYVNIDASTWKPRGRLLYDLEGTILKKVGLAGFQVVREVTHPHECELLVVYREERGEQYAVNAWGTTIQGEFRFSGMAIPHPVTWRIVEFSENAKFASPPYLDALVKFETHPYYFFLGGILMSLLQNDGSLAEGLKNAVEQRLPFAYSPSSVAGERATAQDHFMDSSYLVYQDLAFQRALEALKRQQYSKVDLVPIARKVLDAPLRTLRLQAVDILLEAEDHDSCPRLMVLAKQDVDLEVRTKAQQFLNQCPSF